jgi:CDP-diacylglycerol--glycerol-3-phosphate 3-phosphatidyltransferase
MPKHGRTGPRIRDVPGPRKERSVAAPLFRVVFAWPFRFALTGLYHAGFRAWHLTLLSLAGNAVCGWLLLSGRHFLGGILLLPAGLFDLFDGGMARLRGEESRKGALLDSTADRAADAVVLGALYYSLATQGRTPHAALALSSLVVSLLVSYVRAEGEVGGASIGEGLFTRLERYLALAIGLTVPGALLPALALLTALGTATAAQRVFVGWRRLPRLRPKTGARRGSSRRRPPR